MKRPIREVTISKFKKECVRVLEEVRKTQTPIRITRRGKPIVDIIPSFPKKPGKTWLGSMAGKIQILGDIVSPVIDRDSIEILKS